METQRWMTPDMAKKKTKKKSSRKSVLKPKKQKLSLSPSDLKYYLYERAVQCPEWHVKHFPRYLLWMTKKKAVALREDFCGTSRISMEWVRSAKNRRAVGLDLDPEPLDYYQRFHRDELTEDQRKRLTHEQKNVLKPTAEKFDLIAACNFSFFIFKERETMLQYFRAARASLKKDGALFLEMAGGQGMEEGMEEKRMFSAPGIGRVKYVWTQDDFDAIQAINDYSISFQLPNKRWIHDAFEYHWRLWGIREIRDVLTEAGFSKTHVFWESADSKGDGTGEYVPMEAGDPAHAWIAYVAAIP